MPTYKVKAHFASMPLARTVLNGKTIGLNQSFKLPGKVTVKSPAKERDIPQATQAELKALFEQGNPAIEKTDDAPKEPKETKAKAKEPETANEEIENDSGL